ncbi:HTH-type transcriptional regulator DmlR [compost metagenome]
MGRQFLIPALPAFFERYPGVKLDLQFTDEVVDLLEVRADVAIRSGPLKDSRLVARRLGASRHLVVASPDYLARQGTPQHPIELAQHNCLGFNFRRAELEWPFAGRDETEPEPSGNAQVSDGESLRQMVLAGLGLARLATFQVRDDIAAGRLVAVLEAFNPGDMKPMHALYLGKGGHLPARVRAVLDFLAEHVRID